MQQHSENSWIHRGFKEFVKGRFDNGGDNLYVNARGAIEMIHKLDVNNDGFVDLIFPNTHGYIEREMAPAQGNFRLAERLSLAQTGGGAH